MGRTSSKHGKSQHYRDPMRAFIMGYGERIEASMGAENLYLEAQDLQGLFNPYSKFMDRALHITHSDPEVVKLMEAHLLDRSREWNLGIDLGFVHKLMHLIGYMHESNAFFGKSYCEIVWDKVDLRDNRMLILPIELNFLPTETMRIKINGEYVQRYSLITRMKVFGPFDYKTIHFDKDEIFMLEWPFGMNMVWTNIRYIYKDRMKYLLRDVAQTEAGVSPNTTSYRLLKAMRSSNAAWKVNRQISELKVRRAMRIGAYTDGFAPTRSYDAYLMFRYLTDKAHALNVYITEFNEQVMANIAKKNNWIEVPMLTYTGKYREQAISDLYSKFLEKEITYEEFIDQVAEKD